jgi:hypothetical protein
MIEGRDPAVLTETREAHMPQYMLLIYSPSDEDTARRERNVPAEQFADEGKRWGELIKTMTEDGVLVANHGLAGVDAATTVRVRDGETQISDGPFAETKELLAGEILIDVPDLDTALGYAARVPAADYGSIEIRPLWG